MFIALFEMLYLELDLYKGGVYFDLSFSKQGILYIELPYALLALLVAIILAKVIRNAFTAE